MLSVTKADVHTAAPFSAWLEHKALVERLWELDLFSPNRRPYFCSQLPNGRVRGTNLFSEVYSCRTRGHRCKLQHGKFQFNARKKFLPWGWSSTETSCPERYLVIHPEHPAALGLLWAAGWTRRLEFFSNLQDSRNLWYIHVFEEGWSLDLLILGSVSFLLLWVRFF